MVATKIDGNIFDEFVKEKKKQKRKERQLKEQKPEQVASGLWDDPDWNTGIPNKPQDGRK